MDRNLKLTTICNNVHNRALFRSSARNSAERKAPDVATKGEGIAGSPLAKPEGATDGVFAAGGKLAQDMNKAHYMRSLLPCLD